MSADDIGAERRLLLGPLLRYVDEQRATIWFETDRPGRVEVLVRRRVAPSRRHLDACTATTTPWSASTRCAPNSRTSTASTSTGRRCGRPRLGVPAQRDPHTDPDAPFRLAFGSCRRSATVRPGAPRRARRRRAGRAGRADGRRARRRVARHLLLLGDQVYADDPSDEIVARLREAHSADDAARSRGARRRSRTSRSTRGCTTRRGRRPRSAGCCRPCRAACCSTTTTCATTGTRRCRGVGG